MSVHDERESGEVEVRLKEPGETKAEAAGETSVPRLFSELGTGISTSPLQPASDTEEPAMEEEASEPERPPRLLTGRRKGSVYRRESEMQPQVAGQALSGEQRLLILDAWRRSELTAGEFGKIAGVTAHTLYAWRRRFEALGPAGLDEKKRGAPSGSRVAEATKRAILMMKEKHEEWGCERIHDMLMRSAGFMASAGAVAKVLREAGYESEARKSEAHPDKPREFERAKPNQLWQSDLFTFLLKREGRRLYLVGFMDDHSRFLVGCGIFASSSGAVVREVFEAAIANFGAPEEVLTDQGPQYHTWRGTSEFGKLCAKRGIRQIVARARHPQTLGKIERFWGTLWRECVEQAVFQSLDDARRRVGLFIDYYNFQRTHQGLDGLVPADRYFQAAPQVLETLKKRVEANALDIAQHGTPRQSVYLTGRVGEAGITLHGEGGKLVLQTSEGGRQEVDLTAPGRRAPLSDKEGGEA
ncbi:MAG TPA: DDE-type integrase/transposase/recombinase [Candidatus Polarisedimenticolia bacterium]|nr:DDE-type integrase/transposase/recombinase [Candidatus Polarisedimenticolia bacterium]